MKDQTYVTPTVTISQLQTADIVRTSDGEANFDARIFFD